MFVTDAFIYLHLPKTGGTFVATMLGEIHTRRGDRVETIWIDPAISTEVPEVGPGRAVRVMFTTRNQHGTRQDIPVQYRGRPVLATIRNPFERYVSQFEFAWWRHQPDLFGPVDEIQRQYPHFPNLRFEDYLHLANSRLLPFRHLGTRPDTPGMHTQQFVEYFFRNPVPSFQRLVNGGLTAEDVAGELEGLRLLDQTRLNDDLADALDVLGYAAAEVALVRGAGRVWPPEGGRPPGSPWEPYYSPETRAFVARKERWLFDWLPQFSQWRTPVPKHR